MLYLKSCNWKFNAGPSEQGKQTRQLLGAPSCQGPPDNDWLGTKCNDKLSAPLCNCSERKMQRHTLGGPLMRPLPLTCCVFSFFFLFSSFMQTAGTTVSENGSASLSDIGYAALSWIVPNVSNKRFFKAQDHHQCSAAVVNKTTWEEEDSWGEINRSLRHVMFIN